MHQQSACREYSHYSISWRGIPCSHHTSSELWMTITCYRPFKVQKAVVTSATGISLQEQSLHILGIHHSLWRCWCCKCILQGHFHLTCGLNYFMCLLMSCACVFPMTGWNAHWGCFGCIFPHWFAIVSFN